MPKGKGVLNHIHKYARNDYNLWECFRDSCTHYLSVNSPVGKRSICWKCGEPFVLSELNMKEDKPICDTCKIEVRYERLRS